LKSSLERSVIRPIPAVKTVTPSHSGLKAIRRSRVYSQVAKQLQARIVSKLKPGDMLPPERELVKKFRVSRSSIRDAIRSLEALGLLEPRQGVGTVVRDVSSDAMVRPVANLLLEKQKTIRDLLEARQIIEPALVRRAALRASPEQLAELEAILRRQEEKTLCGQLATEEDTTFHYTLALAGDNRPMMKLVRVLMDLLREIRERSLQGEGRPQKSLAGHMRILAALQQRNPAAAEAAMQQHLSEIEEIVLEKL
jgi:GntR family transcriptional regulator, transcriptional repressor for pyruvate dehydrogenase complex